MALIETWMPPSREHWEWIVYLFQFFPLITLIQYSKFINNYFYCQGKTSSTSRFNIPGKIGWITMEVPGATSLLYCMMTLPPGGLNSLPIENKVMGSLFVIHYIYRAVIAPIIAPSMSPISPQVWLMAFIFQVVNGLSIGGWLAAYGPTSRLAWQTYGQNYKVGGRMELGIMIWAIGFVGNMFHDDELREIRRAAMRNQKRREQEKDETKAGEKKGVDKVYMIPQNGLFRWIFYPHYLCEWIEWAGFWIIGGLHCTPARNFLLNEITTMLPRAMHGREWYEERFGKEKVEGRKAVIPGLL